MPKYPIILGQVTKYVTISFRVCVWGDFFLSVSVFHQIARYLLHHRSGNALKTHPQTSHEKFKTVPKDYDDLVPMSTAV